MYYENIINQIDFLIIVGFSILIFVLNLCFNKSKSLSKVIGNTFFITLSLSIASFILQDNATANLLLDFSEIILFLAFVLLIITKPGCRYFPLINFVIFTTIAAFAIFTFFFAEIPGYLLVPYLHSPVLLGASVLGMYLLRKEDHNKSVLFWSMFLIFTSSVINTFWYQSLFIYLSLILKFAAYLLFFIFFYKEIYNELIRKTSDTEKKLAELTKNLDLEVRKRTFEIEQSNQKLISLSKTDSLTKLLNMKGLLDEIHILLLNKQIKTFSVLMFDIDNFKAINDTFGHVIGDKCIKTLSLLAKSCIREKDRLGRYGGDEFIILLPKTASTQAFIIAERFKNRVAESQSPHFTISIGISTYPDNGRTVKELITAADSALYQSKENGRNTVSYIS